MVLTSFPDICLRIGHITVNLGSHSIAVVTFSMPRKTDTQIEQELENAGLIGKGAPFTLLEIHRNDKSRICVKCQCKECGWILDEQKDKLMRGWKNTNLVCDYCYALKLGQLRPGNSRVANRKLFEALFLNCSLIAKDDCKDAPFKLIDTWVKDTVRNNVSLFL